MKDVSYYVDKFSTAEAQHKQEMDYDYLETIDDPEEIAGYYLEVYKKDAFSKYANNLFRKAVEDTDTIEVFTILANICIPLTKKGLFYYYCLYQKKSSKESGNNSDSIDSPEDFLGWVLSNKREESFSFLNKVLTTKRKLRDKDLLEEEEFFLTEKERSIGYTIYGEEVFAYAILEFYKEELDLVKES